MGQWMGILMNEVDHCYMRKVRVEDGVVHFSDSLTFPVRPMIGTLGVAPAGEAVDCLVPADHGANMDSLNVTTGNTCLLYTSPCAGPSPAPIRQRSGWTSPAGA